MKVLFFVIKIGYPFQKYFAIELFEAELRNLQFQNISLPHRIINNKFGGVYLLKKKHVFSFSAGCKALDILFICKIYFYGTSTNNNRTYFGFKSQLNGNSPKYFQNSQENLQ